MNPVRMIAIPAVALALAACGDNFEWFPDVNDITAPTVSATVAGNQLFQNRTTHVNTLPATVAFSASKPATIYYTTNGNEPTTTSPTVNLASTTTVAGPAITVTNTILKFFGIDKTSNKNRSATQTSYIKSP